MIRQLFLSGLIFVLVACSTPIASTPAPTQVAIQVIYPSALKPWADKLAHCAFGDPAVALYFTQDSNPKPDIFSDEIELILGEPTQLDESAYLSQVGSEKIVVIVNQSNSLNKLTRVQLSAIFSGQTSNWENENKAQIQVWELPPSDPARIAFDDAITVPQGKPSEVMLAPDSNAMLEAISLDSDAIGYLPGSIFITADQSRIGKVKIVSLDETLEKALTQPVIANTPSDPQGKIRDLLVCLETQDQ